MRKKLRGELLFALLYIALGGALVLWSETDIGLFLGLCWLAFGLVRTWRAFRRSRGQPSLPDLENKQN